MERLEKASLVTDQKSLYDDLNEYWSSGRLRVKHRLADLVGEHDCSLYIVDTRVNDMHIWPAPLLADPDARSKLWLFLVSGLADTFRLQNLPANTRFFDRKHSALGDLVSFIKKHSDPELARRMAEVTYLDNVRSFFIRMKNGKI